MSSRRNPVDRVAARVVFGAADHYESKADPGGHRTHTWRYPPIVLGTMPDGEPDWTGVRYGRMTAAYWYRPHKKAAIWVVRCDCGNFEVRRPAIWESDISSRWRGNDACQVCRSTDVALGRVPVASKQSHQDRRNRWIATMLAKGLSVEEVFQVMGRKDITVNGRTAEEIRADLAPKPEPEPRPAAPKVGVVDKALLWLGKVLGGGHAH